MTSLDRLGPVMNLAQGPSHAAAIANLRAGHAFTCLSSDDPAERTALLHAVMDDISDVDTRFVHVCNPLRAPLTIERVFMQAAGPEAEVRLERDGAALTAMLTAQAAHDKRLIVVIEQPETLDAEALAVLHRMAPSFAEAQPRVQVLFCGPLAFAALLEPDSPPAPAMEPEPPAPPAPVSRGSAETRPRASSPPQPPPMRPRSRIPLVLGVMLGALAGAGILAWQRDPDLLRRLGVPIPAPPTIAHAVIAPAAEAAPPALPQPAAETPPVQPAPAPAAPPEAAGPAAEDTAVLRQEFDRFLADRPDAAGLSEANKDELFQEFLERRRAKAAAP